MLLLRGRPCRSGPRRRRVGSARWIRGLDAVEELPLHSGYWLQTELTGLTSRSRSEGMVFRATASCIRRSIDGGLDLVPEGEPFLSFLDGQPFHRARDAQPCQVRIGQPTS